MWFSMPHYPLIYIHIKLIDAEIPLNQIDRSTLKMKNVNIPNKIVTKSFWNTNPFIKDPNAP